MAATNASRPSSMTALVACSGVSPASAVTLANADHCKRVTMRSKPSSAEVLLNRSWNAQ
jgi:hypothetical protein